MKLDAVKQFFSAQGLPFVWRTEPKVEGRAAQLLPKAGAAPLTSGVVVVVPDVHLGEGNDIFRDNSDAHAARLLRFLQVSKALSNAVGAGNFAAIQLGDWYDLFRVMPGRGFAGARQAIETQYADIVAAARALPFLHCIGNHDAALYDNPLPEQVIDVAVARLVGDRILCFHGHDLITLRDIVVHAPGDQAWLRLVDVFASAPFIGPLANLIQQIVDGSSEIDPFADERESIGWDRGPDGPNNWSAPWIKRGDGDQLGSVLASFEQAKGFHVRAALVGHTHRPGIAWTTVETGRAVPIVDVGSWTYGRAEFAIIAEDGIGLARL